VTVRTPDIGSYIRRVLTARAAAISRMRSPALSQMTASRGLEVSGDEYS